MAMEDPGVFIEAPLSFGQLYSWREIDSYPADGKHEANLPATWDLRGFSLDQVQAALRQLIHRHEPLRTTYHLLDGVPVQRVHADPPAPVELVDRIITDAGEPDRSTAELIGVGFAMTDQLCWRAVLVATDGAPMYLSLSFSHLILDVWSVLRLQAQFAAALASAGAEPASQVEPSPRELACEQRQDSAQSRQAGAERYWRRILAAQPADQLPALASGEPQVRIQATLHSDRLGVLAAQVARAHGVTPPAVLLATVAAALSGHTGAERITMSLMSSNRFALEHRQLVSTLNQLIPVLVDVAPGTSLAEHIPKLHWSAASAYRHSSYDLDRVLAIAAGDGYRAFNDLFRCWFNYLQLDAEPLGGAQNTPAELIWEPLARPFGQPIDVRVTVRGGRTSIALRADPQILPADALASVLRQVAQGVALAARNPASSLSDLWNSRGEDLPAALFPPEPSAQTRTSTGAGWLRKAVGLAVRP
ncbi:MAG: condensation domain-containing protein [Jatrophihabitantaceae bacterium]